MYLNFGSSNRTFSAPSEYTVCTDCTRTVPGHYPKKRWSTASPLPHLTPWSASAKWRTFWRPRAALASPSGATIIQSTSRRPPWRHCGRPVNTGWNNEQTSNDRKNQTNAGQCCPCSGYIIDHREGVRVDKRPAEGRKRWSTQRTAWRL